MTDPRPTLPPRETALRDCFDTLTEFLTDECPGENMADEDFAAWEDFDGDVDTLRSILNDMLEGKSLSEAIAEHVDTRNHR